MGVREMGVIYPGDIAIGITTMYTLSRIHLASVVDIFIKHKKTTGKINAICYDFLNYSFWHA